MGKIRSKRSHCISTMAILGDAIYDEEVQHIDSKETTIQTILDQLQSVNVEEKYCGLQTLALFIESPGNVESVISRGLVKVVAPLMMDAAGSVQNAAAGVLRNLSKMQSEVCDAMMEQDVMTPLTFYFHEVGEKWTPTSNIKMKDEDVETFIHCIYLLMNLCRSSELAVKYVDESQVLDILPQYLDLATFGRDVVIAVMQCFFVIVEDNPIAIEKLMAAAESQLQAFLANDGSDPSLLLIKILATGINININGGNVAQLSSNMINQIMSLLAKTLSIDHRSTCHQLSSIVPLVQGSGNMVLPRGKEAQELEHQLKQVSYMLDAQQTAIEILVNICSGDDNEDTSNNSEQSDNDEMEDEEDNCTVDETMFAEDKLPTAILEALISLEMLDKVWARAQPPAENVMLIFREYEGSQIISKKVVNLQTKALLCINNMITTLPIENLGGINGVYKMWVETGKFIFRKKTDSELVESATAVMRAALDKIKFTSKGNIGECNLFSDLAKSDIEMMLGEIIDCQIPEIRSNLFRMTGILALLLVNNLNDTTSSVICSVTKFILHQAQREPEVWVLAEAIDTIVDLFSEEETDIIAAKLNLVDRLTILAPILKNKAKKAKKLPKEYKVLVATANSNLPRFIKYMKERMKNIAE